MARKRIGELLVERGAITGVHLQKGLEHQKTSRQRLGVALIELGFLTEAVLSQVLSDALSIPTVDLNSVQPEWAAIHMLRARFCETHDVFPYALESSKNRKLLLVAMSDPMNAPALQEIEFSTGLKVNARIATLSAVRRAILKYYHKRDPDQRNADSMTVMHKGNVSVQVDDEEIVQGEPLGESRAMSSRSQLAELIKTREAQSKARREKNKDPMAKDLEFLFGARDEANPVEALERRFWALIRVMAKKGLISKEEFAAELDEELK